MALRAQHQQQDQRQETRNMAWMKRTALGLVAVALLAGAGAAVYVQRSFAQLDGSLAVAGLSEAVQVRRDGADVTHIQAQTPQDAWFAMGYVHAQERTWQLEFNRRVMHGQLSEVFGPATVETDKLMRSLDIMGVARRQYAGLPLYAQEALQAYSKGIHAFHQKRPQALPPEFLVLGVQPGGAAGAVWEPEDSVGWALMIALDLGGNWGTEFARLSVARTLDTDRLWQLMPPYPGEPPAASADLAALYRQLGVYRAPAAGAAAAAVAQPHRCHAVPHARRMGPVHRAQRKHSRQGRGRPVAAAAQHAPWPRAERRSEVARRGAGPGQICDRAALERAGR